MCQCGHEGSLGMRRASHARSRLNQPHSACDLRECTISRDARKKHGSEEAFT
jgi:hypothetical protein